LFVIGQGNWNFRCDLIIAIATNTICPVNDRDLA